MRRARRARGPRGQALLRAGAAALGALLLMGATADEPADRLKDPAAEARARALFREIRCLVCQNQSIDESEADLAEDLRKIVRARVAAGESDQAIKAFIVSRYGDFALERPTFTARNAVLWGAPFAVLVLGGGGLILARRRNLEPEAPLTAEEERALLAEGDLLGTNGPGSALIAPHESP